MPKIVQINTVANYGSTGKIMESIGLLAKESGWISKIAVGGRYSNVSKLDTYLISNKCQNRMSAFHSLISGRHGLANKSETERFIQWLRNEAPDIVHLHNFHSYILNYEILFDFLKEVNVPVVWTLHDCWPFTGHCSHFIKYNCYKWCQECFDCPAIHDFPKSLFRDCSRINYTDKKRIFGGLEKVRLVTVSNWLKSCVQRSLLGDYHVDVIHNGVDLSVFRPFHSDYRKLYNLEGKRILLGVSTDWCRSKGLYDYLKLGEILGDDYRIVLLGMTVDQIKRYSRPGILCLPKTNSINELANWYNSADIILNLSYAETFGLPVAEGYACGKPAIVYDNTALSELIVPTTGFKVPTGDLRTLASAIDSIFSFQSFSTDACRERAVTYYNKETNYRRYLSLYNDFL